MKWLIGSTILVWIGLLIFIISMATLVPPSGKFGPDVLMDWPSRLAVLTEALWLWIVATESRQ